MTGLSILKTSTRLKHRHLTADDHVIVQKRPVDQAQTIVLPNEMADVRLLKHNLKRLRVHKPQEIRIEKGPEFRCDLNIHPWVH